MTLQQVIQSLVHDTMLQSLLVLVLVDLVLGVTAAVKAGDFRFSKVSQFARGDLLGKVVPFGVLYAAWKLAPAADVLGVGFEEITRSVGALVIAALVGSLTSSLNDLGLSMPAPLAKGEGTS